MQASKADDDDYHEPSNKRTKYAGKDEEDDAPSVTIQSHVKPPPTKSQISERRNNVPSSTETASEWEDKEDQAS
jgi:hypothetical protein